MRAPYQVLFFLWWLCYRLLMITISTGEACRGHDLNFPNLLVVDSADFLFMLIAACVSPSF
ncbi:hypothetical protein U0355_04255 [Salimicrobium sp. PL1-032A]|uniref:hypothetical protein n=1 Tax=Salimicrobium sp. PL1-032A TaxID=3095364 RepID=UPI003261D0E6